MRSRYFSLKVNGLRKRTNGCGREELSLKFLDSLIISKNCRKVRCPLDRKKKKGDRGRKEGEWAGAFLQGRDVGRDQCGRIFLICNNIKLKNYMN